MKALFDLPPTYACQSYRVEIPRDGLPSAWVRPLTPAERQMIAEVKAWERRDRTTAPRPQHGTPGVPAFQAAVHGRLRQEFGGARVLTAADVRPFTDAEKALFGQIRTEDSKRLLDSRSVQRGIERGTERARRLLNETEPEWEDYSDWSDRRRGR